MADSASGRSTSVHVNLGPHGLRIAFRPDGLTATRDAFGLVLSKIRRAALLCPMMSGRLSLSNCRPGRTIGIARWPILDHVEECALAGVHIQVIVIRI